MIVRCWLLGAGYAEDRKTSSPLLNVCPPVENLPFAICHLSFVICHLSFVICHLSFVICHLSLRFQISDFRFQIFATPFCFEHLPPKIFHRTPNTEHRKPPPPMLANWILAARPKTLLAAFAPVTMGATLALREGRFQLWPMLGALLLSLIHISEPTRPY